MEECLIKNAAGSDERGVFGLLRFMPVIHRASAV